MSRSIMLAALTMAAAAPLAAQAPAVHPVAAHAAQTEDAGVYARRSLNAVRLSGPAPSIDGKLDEAIWQQAPVATDFIQMQPEPGKPATQKTEVRFAYDDGLRAYEVRKPFIYNIDFVVKFAYTSRAVTMRSTAIGSTSASTATSTAAPASSSGSIPGA